ncbi:hypothetical protein [Hymenobacter sp. DG25A]|uniref:hypothetical protein n=1 Tax=Hymenobacter sp. DG25A TaxID=1385663 RepID=UPI0006BDA0F7|nr:hypothetical protein [Hymenobacter sp. DG25A]ALD20092.1 hypothetical protein AM218_01140 [Hymenobacter sp. DG25A]
MSIKPSLLLLIPFILLSSCNKIDFGPDEGYVGRDNYNYPTGAKDNTDWTSDTDWDKKERELFKDLKLDLNATQRGGISQVYFFPNPVKVNGQGILTFRNNAPVQLSAVVVDDKHKVLDQFSATVSSSNISFHRLYSSEKFNAGMYRMYYVMYDIDGTLYYKGHGDIKIVE